jgi:preprotein translocase subunit YajC
MISLAHAQAAAPATPGFEQFLPLIIIFVLFWFMLIRPQMSKAKEQQKMISELAKGDEVLTQGGIAGRITRLGENYLGLEVAEGKDGPIEITVQKSAVAALLPKGSLKNL